MDYFFLILILILILVIYFYNCHSSTIIEGNTANNKRVLAIGDTLEVGEFITSQSNGKLFGLFAGKIGIYTIPANTTLISQVSNEGLTQEFLSNHKITEVNIGNEAYYLKFNTSGLFVTDSNLSTIWSIDIAGLQEGSTLALDNKGRLRKIGGAIIDIETGNEQEASGTVKTSVENILYSLIPSYTSLNEIISTFYSNVDIIALDNFRHKYNEVLSSDNGFTGLQNWAYYYLSNTDNINDDKKAAIIAALNRPGVYGNKSFCTEFDDDFHLFSPTIDENEINNHIQPYNDLNDLYNIITLNNTGIKDFIDNNTASNLENFIFNIIKIGDTQQLLAQTGINKVLKTLYCTNESPSETFTNISGCSNYKPFSGNIDFSIV